MHTKKAEIKSGSTILRGLVPIITTRCGSPVDCNYTHSYIDWHILCNPWQGAVHNTQLSVLCIVQQTCMHLCYKLKIAAVQRLPACLPITCIHSKTSVSLHCIIDVKQSEINRLLHRPAVHTETFTRGCAFVHF